MNRVLQRGGNGVVQPIQKGEKRQKSRLRHMVQDTWESDPKCTRSRPTTRKVNQESTKSVL